MHGRVRRSISICFGRGEGTEASVFWPGAFFLAPAFLTRPYEDLPYIFRVRKIHACFWRIYIFSAENSSRKTLPPPFKDSLGGGREKSFPFFFCLFFKKVSLSPLRLQLAATSKCGIRRFSQTFLALGNSHFPTKWRIFSPKKPTSLIYHTPPTFPFPSSERDSGCLCRKDLLDCCTEKEFLSELERQPF